MEPNRLFAPYDAIPAPVRDAVRQVIIAPDQHPDPAAARAAAAMLDAFLTGWIDDLRQENPRNPHISDKAARASAADLFDHILGDTAALGDPHFFAQRQRAERRRQNAACWGVPYMLIAPAARPPGSVSAPGTDPDAPEMTRKPRRGYQREG